MDVHLAAAENIAHDLGKTFTKKAFQLKALRITISNKEISLEDSSSMQIVQQYHESPSYALEISNQEALDTKILIHYKWKWKEITIKSVFTGILLYC